MDRRSTAVLAAGVAAVGAIILLCRWRSHQQQQQQQQEGTSSSAHSAMLVYGSRRIREDQLQTFRATYDAFAKFLFATNPAVKIIFAFPDPQDPLVYWHVFLTTDPACFADDSAALNATYASSADDPDWLDVYGGYGPSVEAAAVKIAAAAGGVRYRFHQPLAGFMKASNTAGIPEGPLLLGVRRSAVNAGKVEALAASFQVVCDMWYRKIPGILAASVSRDHNDPNVVHDLRMFADHASFKAHVDKSDEALTTAMAEWFQNYDTSVPFTGELYAPGTSTSDKAMTTSSIKTSAVRTTMLCFNYGDGSGMLGPLPDMAAERQ